MYLIELDRWNIKQGFPRKPYTDADFLMADTNIQGINNAIQYAFSNGYDGVLLPKGQYALCYPREIKMLSNMTFNLNGSTLKVIYNSDRKSPFDNRTTTDFYKFGGNSIVFENATDAHLTGGTIVGCRDDRSFSNPSEVAMESTYGVKFSKGTSFSSIKNCVVRDYMGDNITITSESIAGYAEFNQGLTLNALDYSTGQPVASTNTVITRYIDLPQDIKYDSIMLTGAGYTRLTNLVSKDFDIFFYGQNDSFIGVMKKRKIYTDISVPVGAKKFRLLFYNETNTSKYIQITIRWGSIPHHNLVEHNEIYNGHRGGISLGGSYNVIQHNLIRDNGKGTVRFLDGKPIFNDPTRYSINQEDSYGDNCIIRNNLIYGSYHGILAGCYSIQIEHNHIYNIDNIAINLYSVLHATVKGNFIYNCLNNIGLMTSNFESAHVKIIGNSFHSGSMNINNSTYEILLAENNFVNPNLIVTGEGCSFINNHIKFTTPPSATVNIQANKIEGCTFKSTTLIEITSTVYQFEGCTFDNITVRIQTLNYQTLAEKVLFQMCNFKNSVIRNHLFNGKARLVTVSKSKLIDTSVAVGITNVDNQNPFISVEDCDIVINTITSLFTSDTNRLNSTFKAERCNIEITNPNFSYLLKSGSGVAANQLILKRCTIEYKGSAPLRLNYYSNKIHISKFISAYNKFINIFLPAEDSGIYIGYDPDYQFKQNISLQPDGDKYSAIVTHNLNTLDPNVLCVSTAAEILLPNVMIIDQNSIVIKNSVGINLKVTVTKL
ncbi:right-handed parallel beta-helix repeat-containing protein [Neobacillus sp. BF23-41]|uniref:right-handed parallel beta-helix repeat-containing protein n=1 Tax=Neobacillus sp. BF23-41 TaxID=3240280 RepID=UPI0034E5031E